jgi:FMN-dependent NADH-azoreductase
MPRLLQIQSSPNLQNSVTRTLSDRFVETWIANYAGVEVDELDLAADPLPHFDAAAIEGLTALEADRSAEAQARALMSDRLIAQLEAADILVIGAPMINFSISSQLKAWFDFVSIAGRTFQFAAPGIAKGLLFGKKAFVVLARGGDYADFPANAFDHHEPLLRTLLGFLGIYDVSFIRAEGMRAKEEEVSAIMANAEEVIARLAA